MDPRADSITEGPAKWAAVVALGLTSLGGLAWSVWTRPPGDASRAPGVLAAPLHGDDADRAPAQPAPVREGRLNINTATAAELELLPGIGPSLAGRIVAHRAEHGAFRRVDDLDDVPGIGPRTVEKLRPLVTVE